MREKIIVSIVALFLGFLIGSLVFSPPEQVETDTGSDPHIGQIEQLTNTEILERAEELNKRQAERDASYKLYIIQREKWLADNPPVEVLFDRDKRRDMEYVFEYLEQNPIAGDCGAGWIADVVCWSSNGALRFPTKRP